MILVIRAVTNQVRQGTPRVRVPPCLDATEGPPTSHTCLLENGFFGIKLFLCSNYIRTQTITRVPVVISSNHCKNFVLNLTKNW